MPTWRCLEPRCGLLGTRMTQDVAQRAAEKHTKATGHGTATSVRDVDEEED